MNDFQFYFELGLRHVLDFSAYDHMLFLVVLSVPFTVTTWKRLLLLISLFTIGHTVSLLVSGFDLVLVNSTLMECLIPMTIFLGAVYELYQVFRNTPSQQYIIIGSIAIGFGLIHGFGFATYYNMINEANEVLPLLLFALGVEVSQIVIAIMALSVAFIFQKLLQLPQHLYIKCVVVLIIGITVPMILNTCLLF